MKISNEVTLHQESVDYLNDVFSKYTKVEKLLPVIKDPIIHIYPVEDTYDNHGNLNGYMDALFCDMHIYDIHNRTVWKSKKTYDAINSFSDLHVVRIKVFKDLSTMVQLEGNYRISTSFGALEVNMM